MTNRSITSERTLLLTGRSDAHVVPYKDKHRLHPRALEAFLRLQERAAVEGFGLEITSSFRDYARQERIWNRKATGQAALLDAQGRPLEYATLSPEEVVRAILRWSALPGSSRHHWGTDIDVYDSLQIDPQKIQLVPEEYGPGGPSHRLHMWLEGLMERGDAEGFYRPFRQDRGGISPEPWHLSFAPESEVFFREYDLELYLANIREAASLELRDVLLANADEFFQRFFKAVDSP